MSLHMLIDGNKARLLAPLLLSFLFIALGFVTGCSTVKQDESQKIRIALSRGSGSESYEQYAKWLMKVDPNVECVDLYKSVNDIGDLMSCAGLILTGGPDVEPFRYGKEADSSRCEMDVERDHKEFLLIASAMKEKIPVLGICRGEQILNVSFGGSLIVDIPTDYKTDIKHQCDDPSDCYHEINVVPGSLLDSICGGVKTGLVNSNHHQAINDVCYMFKVSARSKDGIIEAVEWDKPARLQFLLAVQWHPERLDSTSPYSYPIARAFLDKAKAYKVEIEKMMEDMEKQASGQEKK